MIWNYRERKQRNIKSGERIKKYPKKGIITYPRVINSTIEYKERFIIDKNNAN